MSSPGRLTPRLYLLACALLFSTGGTAVKWSSLSGWQLAGFRSGLAVVVLVVYLAVRREPRPRFGVKTWLVGAACAATLILYVSANKLTTAASAIFLQSTAPLYVLLLSPWLLGEPVRRRELAYMAALGVGLGLFFVGLDPVSATAPDPMTGNLLATLAGFTWALTVIGLRWLGRGGKGAGGDGDLGALICGNALAFAVTLPWALPVVASAPQDWAVVGYLGLFQVAGAYLLLLAGLRGVPAFETSLILLLDPVLTPLWAWSVHGERVGAWSLAGGGLILLATVIKTWAAARLGGGGGGRG